MGVRTFVNSCNCVLLVCLYYFKMPPTEQQTLPIGESTLKSIGDLKTLNKAIKFPVVSDTVKKATDVVTQISENAHVETARQYLQDGIKTLSETEAFTNIQGKVKELNENPRVQEVITNINLKEKVGRLDTFAADGIESLASAVPALRAPTPQLVETAKDTANSYLYLASFSVAQISLRIAEKTLSLAEGTTDILKSDTEGLMASTSSRIKQVRRAIRAVKRAGERKSILEKDPVARTGIVGSIASLLHMNSILGYLGLRLEAKENESDYNDDSDKETIEPVEVDETDDQDEPVDDGDDNHRHNADLKGDLDGYDSQEDPDYDPKRDEDVEDEREDKELSEDEKEETVEVREDRDLSEDDKDSEDEAVVEEAKEEETVEVSQDKDLSKDDKYSEDEAVVEEVKEEETVEVRQDKDLSEDDKYSEDEAVVEEAEKEETVEVRPDKDLSEDDKYSEDEALVEEAVEIEEDTGIQQEQVEVRDSEETNYYGRRPDVNPLLLL